MAIDPIAQFKRIYQKAQKARIKMFDACVLATADRRGRPSARFVLLKDADERGFTFYTNRESRKGKHLRTNPHASLVFYWDKIDKQVRIEGRVKEVSSQEADTYWASRPRESNLGALASDQSRPIRNRTQLLKHLQKLRRVYKGIDIPRPKHWTGFRIKPASIEFWTRKPFRLHDRECFMRRGNRWKRVLLQP